MADDDDFFGVGAFGGLDQMLREAVDALVPFGAFAVRELPGPDRVAQEIEHVSGVLGVFQHDAEQGDEQGGRDGDAENVGNAERIQPLLEDKGDGAGARGFQQQHQMRIGDEGCETPVRLAEAGDGAGEDQPPVDPHRAEHRAPDRRRQILLDEILEPEEIVGGAGLPVLRLGIDGPGRDLVVGRDLGPADGGLELVKPAELAQFGPEHAVILRQPARIVALNIDDMAVLDAHVMSPDDGRL